MYNPPHPGKVVKRSLIDNTKLSITEAAVLLGVGRISLSKIINGHSGISPEMAVRLSIVLKTSSNLWLNMQRTYDLWYAEKKRNILKLRNGHGITSGFSTQIVGRFGRPE